MRKAIENLANLQELFENTDVKGKRKIIGSIFHEKFVFDGFHYRTARINEAVELIYSVEKAFIKMKTGQTEKNFDLSSLVPGTGFEPAHLAAPPPEDGASTNFATRASF